MRGLPWCRGRSGVVVSRTITLQEGGLGLVSPRRFPRSCVGFFLFHKPLIRSLRCEKLCFIAHNRTQSFVSDTCVLTTESASANLESTTGKRGTVRFSRRTVNTLQAKAADELAEIFSDLSDTLEAAAAMSSPSKGRGYVVQELEQLRERIRVPASNGRKSDGEWAGSASVW